MTDERVIAFPYEVVTGPPFGVWHRVSDDLEIRVFGSDAPGTLRVRAVPRPAVGDDLGQLLYELMTDAQRLLEMLNRYGRLWQPEPSRAHPDVERLPLLAARVVAAAMHQPEEMK